MLPAAVGVLVGWSLRHSDEDPRARLRTVGIAGALIGFGCVLLGTLAGGRLGHGPFNPVSVPVGLLSVAAFGWIAVPGSLVAWLAGSRRMPAPPMVVEEEPEPEPVEEPEEEDLPAEPEEEPQESEEPEEQPEEAPEEESGPDDAEEPVQASDEPKDPGD